MPDHSADEQFLHRAIDLARHGIGLASPNPLVGAAVVDPQGNVIGTGTYTFDGLKHAEILALQSAGEKARGSSLYINLEPHAHQGRTPPCTDALIHAGIRRVVASMADPNPRVSGRGFEQLRAAGIQVEVGILEPEARRLNEAFARYIRHGVPLVTMKSAMTLDGKIAPSAPARTPGSPGVPAGGWITGETARLHVQEQRHENDAVLVGVGTILADDPLLTDRSGKPRRRRLLRVVLDSHLRLPLESRLVQSARGGDVLVFCVSADQKERGELQKRGIQVEQILSAESGRPDIQAVLHRLAELEVTSLMIEGGSTINGIALASGVVDKVFLYYAPQIMGDADSLPFASEASFGGTQSPWRARQSHLHRFGDDVAFEAYLRDPYGN
jgi:diaminohydroxyphosphoribosylaminopyrimidine deaminase / 5-amino-6-(5-phosphoribosylamino)uracil reductase